MSDLGNFSFQLPVYAKEYDTATLEHFKQWAKLAEKKEHVDTWSSNPMFPGYSFKNLRMLPGEDKEKPGELTLNFIYDDWKTIDF